MKMLVIFGCVSGLFFVLERLRPRGPQRMFRRGFTTDVLYLPIHFGLRVGVNFLLADLLTDVGNRLLPGRIGWVAGRPIWVQAVVVLVVLDFLFYVMHRLKHSVSWWWRLHETHHSSEQLDFLASARFHPLEKLLDRVIFLLPLTLLDPSEPALLIWSTVDVFFGMMSHSNARIRLGPLSYVLVGPELHRRHHLRDPRYRECNYGNNLSIFDWIFGTAVLSSEPVSDFGTDDVPYPHDSIWRQFLFAFRPVRQEASKPQGVAVSVAE